MLTLVATWGSSAANVYSDATLATTFLRDAYLDNAHWLVADGPKKAAALAQATRDIDAGNYTGTRYFYKQALAFPRVPPGLGLSEVGPYGINSVGEPDAGFFNFVEQDEYLRKQKVRLEQACAIQACELLRRPNGRDLHREAQQRGIASQSTSRAGISESYSYGPGGSSSSRLAPDALDLLKAYRCGPSLSRGSGPDATYT